MSCAPRVGVTDSKISRISPGRDLAVMISPQVGVWDQSIISTQRHTKLKARYHHASGTLVWYIRERDAMSESSDPLQEKCRCKSL